MWKVCDLSYPQKILHYVRNAQHWKRHKKWFVVQKYETHFYGEIHCVQKKIIITVATLMWHWCDVLFKDAVWLPLPRISIHPWRSWSLAQQGETTFLKYQIIPIKRVYAKPIKFHFLGAKMPWDFSLDIFWIFPSKATEISGASHLPLSVPTAGKSKKYKAHEK